MFKGWLIGFDWYTEAPGVELLFWNNFPSIYVIFWLSENIGKCWPNGVMLLNYVMTNEKYLIL